MQYGVIDQSNQMFAYFLYVNPSYGAGMQGSNKFYQMKQTSPSHFTATWGRVEGGRRGGNKQYSISDWDKTAKAKVKKGYRDVTSLHVVGTSTPSKVDTSQVAHTNPLIKEILQHFQRASSGVIQSAYKAHVANVTQPMLDDAQNQLNLLVDSLKAHQWPNFNQTLVDLFHIIPRKMVYVKHHLLDLEPGGNPFGDAQRLLTSEQDLLDVMKGQVVIHSNTDTDPERFDLLSSIGITANPINTSETKMIKKLLGDSSNRFAGAIKVSQPTTQHPFDSWITNAKHTAVTPLWHGSRTENWISILTTGLVLYPTSAVISGKMFGYGLYFASRARKSIGYSSAKNSYWTNGTDNYGYLAVFDVHTGRELRTQKHRKWAYDLKEGHSRLTGYDSLYAESGWDLQNDEIIVYNQKQCTVKYIVRIS